MSGASAGDVVLPATRRFLDRHFRWRGDNVTRLEALSDSVFAIVLGLLFLRAAPPETFSDLETAMKALVPFAATFAIVGYVWVEHWLFSRRYDLQDAWTTFFNLLLLFLLLFYAYPLKFLFTLLFVSLWGPIGGLTRNHMAQGFHGEADAVRLFVWYGAGYGAIFLVLALMYARASALGSELRLNEVERLLTRSGITQCLLQTGVATLSIVVACTGLGLGFGLPGWLYCGIGPLLAWHGAREGRRVQRLRAAA